MSDRKHNDVITPIRVNPPATLAEQIIQAVESSHEGATVRKIEIKAEQVIIKNATISVSVEV